MTDSPTVAGALPELPPWPIDDGWSDPSEYRFDLILALRARLELAVSLLKAIKVGAETELSDEHSDQLREVIAACREPK